MKNNENILILLLKSLFWSSLLYVGSTWKDAGPPAVLLEAKSEDTSKFQRALATSPVTQELFSILLTEWTPATHTLHPQPALCAEK